MQSDVLKDYYRPLLEQNHFISIPCPDKFSQAGQCWEIAPAVGSGRGGAAERGQLHCQPLRL